MSESDSIPGDEHVSTRSKMKSLLEGLSRGKDELIKGKLVLEHSLGLGHKPNVIPPGEAEISGEHRTVHIGWHPVAGFAGKWFAEKTGLGKKISEKVHKYPDPTQHWAVLVGSYVHELWMDEHLDVIYINEEVGAEEWHTFEVGRTSFNDEALRRAGEMVIYNMRAKKPAYNLINNNCQNFALLMLDAIQVGGRRSFASSFAIYQRVTGAHSIQDLSVDNLLEEEGEGEQSEGTESSESPQPSHEVEPGGSEIVQTAQQVMNENTTHLDNHHSLF